MIDYRLVDIYFFVLESTNNNDRIKKRRVRESSCDISPEKRADECVGVILSPCKFCSTKREAQNLGEKIKKRKIVDQVIV